MISKEDEVKEFLEKNEEPVEPISPRSGCSKSRIVRESKVVPCIMLTLTK